MQNVNYPLQKKLFEKISEQHRNRAAAVAHYRKRFHFSRSKAYAHFNGERPIEGDLLLRLLSEYGYHDLDIWPEGWPETHFVVTVPSLQPNLNAYLTVLNSDLEHLQQHAQGHLYHSVGDLPLLLLKSRRRLAAFLLFYHFNYEHAEPRYKQAKFGTTFSNIPQVSAWLDGCREALQHFHKIPGTEYWSPKMLDSLLVKLNLVRILDDFTDPGEYRQLTEEVHILIREMEQMVDRGAKLSGSILHAFNHQGLLHNNMLVGESDTVNFLYLNYGLLDIHRYHQSNVIETYLAQIKRASTTALPLNSLKNRKDFFAELRAAVDRHLVPRPVNSL